MKVLELFAGTRSIGKEFEAKGHEVFSVEWDKDFKNIDLYADISTLTAKEILEKRGSSFSLFNSKYAAVRYLSISFIISYIIMLGVLDGGQFIYFQF